MKHRFNFALALSLATSTFGLATAQEEADATLVDLATIMEAGDVQKGEKRFKRRCTACHVMDAEKKKTGPHLINIIGRPSASVETYKYSKAMAEADLVWDQANLTAYLTKPKKFLPGNKMAFAGLRKPEQIQNILAYFASLQTAK